MSRANGNFNYEDSVTLKEYFETRLNGVEDKLELNLKLNQIALDKASTELNTRLENMNQFRAQMNRQESTYLTKENYESRHQTLINDINSLKETRAELKGRASQQSVYIAYIIAIIGIVLSMYDIIRGI